MKKFWKYSLRIVVIASISWVGFKFLHAWDRRADGFEIEKIYNKEFVQPFPVKHNTHEECQKVNKILKQPFYYLGHGFQCYVFESSDKKWVLKFFRHQRLSPPSYFALLPDFFFKNFKEKKLIARKYRTHFLFEGFTVGYEMVPECTGIVFIHLNKTNGCHPTITIYDKISRAFDVRLDEVEFILQHKAILIKPEFIQLMQKEDVDSAKKRLSQIFELIIFCAQKNIIDTDGAVIRKDNLGFLEDKAVFIDSGKLKKIDHIPTRKEMHKNLLRLGALRYWFLEQKWFNLIEHFDHEVERTCSLFD